MKGPYAGKAGRDSVFSTNLLTKILIFENPKGKNFVFSVSMVSLKTDCHDSEIGGGLGPRISCGTSPLLMSRAIFREGRPRKGKTGTMLDS